MERTFIGTRNEKASIASVQLAYIGIFALVIGSVDHSIAYAFSFLYVSYFYIRDIQECKTAVGGILIGSLCCGFFATYLYALGFTIFFLSTHILRLLERNIYRSIPYLCACMSIPYSLYAYGLSMHVVAIACIVYFLMFLDHQDFKWIQKKLVLTTTMYGVLTLSFTLVILLMAPFAYAPIILSAGFFITAFFCDIKSVFLLLLLSYLTFPQVVLSTSAILIVFMISLWKSERWQLIVGLLLFGAIAQADVVLWIALSLCAVTALVYQETLIPFHLERHYKSEQSVSAESLLKRQLQNFSSIFQSLSEYYANMSDVESMMLSNMALALKYSGDALKKIDGQESVKQRILKAMEGYQYEVLSFVMEEPSEGNIVMEMDIRNITKTEIKSTLLPLLEVLTHEHLKVTEVKHHRFTSGYHHIIMENNVPYSIDAYADSQKNMFESSGDAFSIFRFRNSMICMISDGMGSGERAATSSRLITNIFQRMVVSGVSKADSIRCINKLLQSDAYATLDVICFDCSEGKAYIFKSAACPTFLIRNDQLYEVNGSSLPVGIVASIEPDCFVADMQEGDEYLMVSDGIFMDEIYHWLKEREATNAKTSLESLMRVLRQKQRLDDSTAVLSKIHKH